MNYFFLPMNSYSWLLPHSLCIICQVLCESLGMSGAEESMGRASEAIPVLNKDTGQGATVTEV